MRLHDYDYKCPECEKVIFVSTTGNLEEIDKIECSNCGRISEVTGHCVRFYLVETDKKISPSKFEKVNALSQKGGKK